MAGFQNGHFAAGRPGEADIYLKLILLGDAGTGKTSLMNKFTQKRPGEVHPLDHSLDTASKIITRAEKTIKLEIRDTAGMERYRSLTKSHYNGAAGALVLFDLTDETTFGNVSHWMDDLEKYSDNSRVEVVLVGTRCHRQDKRKVSADRLQKKAEHFDAASMEVSVEENTNVNEVFDLIVDRVLESQPGLLRGEQPIFLPTTPTKRDCQEDVYINCSQCCSFTPKHKDTLVAR